MAKYGQVNNLHAEEINSQHMYELADKLNLSAYIRAELIPALASYALVFVVSYFVQLGLKVDTEFRDLLSSALAFIAFVLVILVINIRSAKRLENLSLVKFLSRYEKGRRTIISCAISGLGIFIFIYFVYYQLSWFNILLAQALLIIALFLGNVILMYLNYETGAYLFFGVLTSVVSLLSFAVLDNLLAVIGLADLSWTWVLSQTGSFILSILFAFVTNRELVFSHEGSLLKEFLAFVGSRVLSSLVFEYGGMFIFINLLSLNRQLSKLMAAVLVTLANYLISKFLVFRER